MASDRHRSVQFSDGATIRRMLRASFAFSVLAFVVALVLAACSAGGGTTSADVEAGTQDSSDGEAGPSVVVIGDEAEAGGPETTADAALKCGPGQAMCQIGCCETARYYCLDLEAGRCDPPLCIAC